MPAPAASDGGSDGRPHRSSHLQPLTQVTALNGDVYASFDHLITESNAIPDERFQRFISILKGEKLNATNAQLKRDREKLLNQKELEVSGLLALPMLRMRCNKDLC